MRIRGLNKFAQYHIHGVDGPIQMATMPTLDLSKLGGNNGSPMQQGVPATQGQQVIDQKGQQIANANNTDPNNPSTPPQGGSPLDAFVDMFKNKPTDPNAPKPAKTIFDATDEDFSKVAEKIDVSGGITQEMYKSLGMNSPEQQKGLGVFANTIARQVAAQLLPASQRFAKTGMELGAQNASGTVLQQVTVMTAKALIEDKIPNASHAAFAPLVDMAVEKFMEKNPNAKPNQIAAKVVEYFNSIGSGNNTQTKSNSGEDNNGMETFWQF